MSSCLTLRYKQLGVSMIEVLIALLVLMIGVLGFSALQMKTLAHNNNANHRVMAVLIAQDAIERMQLNKKFRQAYLDKNNWKIGRQGTKPPQTCIEKKCNSEQMANWDMADLSWQAANQLLGGRILIEQCKFEEQADCVIVSWEEQLPENCTNSTGINTASDSKCFVVEVIQ